MLKDFDRMKYKSLKLIYLSGIEKVLTFSQNFCTLSAAGLRVHKNQQRFCSVQRGNLERTWTLENKNFESVEIHNVDALFLSKENLFDFLSYSYFSCCEAPHWFFCWRLCMFFPPRITLIRVELWLQSTVAYTAFFNLSWFFQISK